MSETQPVDLEGIRDRVEYDGRRQRYYSFGAAWWAIKDRAALLAELDRLRAARLTPEEAERLAGWMEEQAKASAFLDERADLRTIARVLRAAGGQP